MDDNTKVVQFSSILKTNLNQNQIIDLRKKLSKQIKKIDLIRFSNFIFNWFEFQHPYALCVTNKISSIGAGIAAFTDKLY